MTTTEQRLRAALGEIRSIVGFEFGELKRKPEIMDPLRHIGNIAREALAVAPEDEGWRDDPEMDATDAAHPAWWRAHDHTSRVFCELVTKILDGKDDGSGFNHEPWHTLRRRLLTALPLDLHEEGKR